jgi:hypothetical protein
MLPEGPVCDAGRPCTKGNPKACMHVGDSGTLRIYQSTHAGYSLSGSSWANRPAAKVKKGECAGWPTVSNAH